jgi:5-methylcytosine-specific restriction endonuclease McrA
MGGKRINLTHRQKARLLQEANNECPFCDISDAGVLEFHHIDGDSSHTVLDNLIALCPTCHSKIGDTITDEVVVKMKEKLQKGFKRNEEKKRPLHSFKFKAERFIIL